MAEGAMFQHDGIGISLNAAPAGPDSPPSAPVMISEKPPRRSPTQATAWTDLAEGQIVALHSEGNPSCMFRVCCLPYVTDYGSAIRIGRSNEREIYGEHEILLSEYGIEPALDGRYNAANWIEIVRGGSDA